ncbi:hypothetical protein GMES_0026 [Paraglaciecola mesophila KMM 241]|uniref:Uncharacterized protein n=1 Tax=Paraglaciecola mesophila KMM 241 TaxID=1128912 RepID=K6YEH5_9ALTE|nr:hypothetical protein GMES_0026 [Paraglaciecola mesophila KMM 241]
MAGIAGFEPTNDGIKTRCLTTWRYPNKTDINNLFIENGWDSWIRTNE